ncbi:hypothetical protein C1646_774465 [Rhizophagus diaphanus]|nr:hypothetical protein C1646_774465 [Rhizophagus diaphanus] [Rhizophagus sp. MUCL 43196]
MMQVKEFLTILEEDIIYKVPNISEFANIQENSNEQIKLLGKIKKFIKKKQINSMEQITID